MVARNNRVPRQQENIYGNIRRSSEDIEDMIETDTVHHIGGMGIYRAADLAYSGGGDSENPISFSDSDDEMKVRKPKKLKRLGILQPSKKHRKVAKPAFLTNPRPFNPALSTKFGM